MLANDLAERKLIRQELETTGHIWRVRSAVKRMSEIVSGWHLRRHTNLTWEHLVAWIGPVIRGWMAYYGRFRHSGLRPLLSRINHRVQQWIRAKYRRLKAYRAMKRAWDRITAQMPGLLPHWRWETGAWY
jgi:hypothetical protein